MQKILGEADVVLCNDKQSFCKSCQPMRAEWLRSDATSTIVCAKCLSLHNTTSASPKRLIMPLLALQSSVIVGLIFKLASLAVSADTIDCEAPVSGMQFTSSPLVHTSGGPSHRGISGVGWLEGV